MENTEMDFENYLSLMSIDALEIEVNCLKIKVSKIYTYN